MKRFFRNALIWFAGLVAILAILLILLYAEEDWRGARDWTACQKELAAKGETLDLRQLAPPGKPEDDLSKTPIFAPLYKEETSLKAPIRQIDPHLQAPYSEDLPKYSQYMKGQPLDLTAWQTFYRSQPKSGLTSSTGTPAQDVLEVLSQFDPQMEEIDKVVSNPNAYFPVNYKSPLGTPLAGVTGMIRLAKFLQLRGIAHLENNEVDLAEKDYLFSFRLNRPIAKNCFLVNYLVIAGVRAIDESILWEGLKRHAWNNTQLQAMESASAAEDMLALAIKSYLSERAATIQTLNFLREQDPKKLQGIDLLINENSGLRFLAATWFLRPSGWWHQDQIHYILGLQILIDSIHPTEGLLNPTNFSTVWSSGTMWHQLYTPLAEMALPSNQNAGPSIAKAETYRRLTRLACRLEEYRIAKGQYPEKLEELPDLPPHLNQEVLSEQPLRYSRKGDGYQLYSVGWDQKDDGGVIAKETKDGDWAWPSP